MDKELQDCFDYLDKNPGVLSLGERDMVNGFKKYLKEHKTLSERQQKTLFEIVKYRKSAEKHLY